MTPSQDSQSKGDLGCSCIDNTLDIIQRLDDDEFCLRSLAFDQVLKLQKWLVFQCLRPLQCHRCGNNARAQSAILVICERIIEMFRCLSNRLRRLLSGLNMSVQQDGMEAFGTLQLPEPFTGAHAGPLDGGPVVPGQLFDGETGQSGVLSTCTLHLFSTEFRAQYSSDEQCQMIHVLAKMQIENCARLLKRLGSMCESHGARSGKIAAMEKRLRDAGNTTDESLEAISHAFSLQI